MAEHLLPKSWPEHARAAVLHAISLASTAMTIVLGRWQCSDCRSTRRAGEIDALRTEVTLLHEEVRIKDGRMASLAAARRPHYRALSRMTILELKSARGWNTAETARHFLLNRGPWLPG
jgi:hypothetical protein